MIERPMETEYAPFYAGYVSLVPESDVLAVLGSQPVALQQFAEAIPAQREQYSYAPGKWSIREVFSHLIDAERVFGYRAFCIGRGEQNLLPGFDENQYVAGSDGAHRRLADLVNEFTLIREASLVYLRRLDETVWLRSGNANGTAVSVRALGFIMAGHVRHHIGVLKSRYNVELALDH